MTVGDSSHPSGDSVAVRAAKDITFGSIAGMVSKVFEHPFDLTKVRLQAQVLDTTARFNGPIDCLTKTWKNEGVRGLYRGLPAPIVGAMAENASLFLAYREFSNLIHRINHKPFDVKLSMPEIALASAGAGAVTSFFLTPIELVKCKMQVQMLVAPPVVASASGASAVLAAKPAGPISVLASVIRNTGFRGLWLGHTGTLIRETGGAAAWLTTKEFVASVLVTRRQRLQQNQGLDTSIKPQLQLWESAVSGAVAGAAYNVALFPADTVKSAMQTEEELRPQSGRGGPGNQQKPSFLRTFAAMYRAQGVRGLYAGCGITVARAIPSSGMIFVIYDGLSRRFG